ncbi:MAG: Holliday junction branch migration protein RuvA [Acidimicrobiia bacterium]|nr:Holliday junction branch migration protein RuvA [Acidimicrobiia bacterium]
MIAWVRGTLSARRGGEVVVDVGGVGHRVAVPPGCRLPRVGEDVVIHTHLHVREDVMALYGFPSESERDTFEVLLGCQGVGPKVALACLSVLSPEALRRAVVTDDVATLQRVPGIGKRSAEKIVFELGPRLGAGVSGDTVPVLPHDEVREALAGLGYAGREVDRAVSGLPEDGEVEDLLRRALRTLGGGS